MLFHYFPIIFWTIFCGLFASLLYLLIKAKSQKVSSLLLSCLSVLTLLLVLEIAFRVRHVVVRDIPFFININAYFDPELGWKGSKNVYGPNTANKKVLIIGDSFTEGIGIEEDSLYPAILSKKTSYQIISYGGRGYGTLQELIALEKLFPKYKPDLVILQVCSNDFINNKRSLEQKSYFQNALMMRPYLEDNQRVLAFPGKFGKARFFLTGSSRLAHFIFTKVDTLYSQMAQNGKIQTIETVIGEKGINHAEYNQAVLTTKTLLKEFEDLLNGTPLIVFVSDDIEPALGQFRKISQDLEINFIDQIPKELKKHEEIHHPDSVHWNEKGHKIVGSILKEYL